MSSSPDPFQFLTDQQFAALFTQAAQPVLEQVTVVEAAILSLSNGQMAVGAVNQQLQAFTTAYQGLAPYFLELSKRATPPSAPPAS